MKIAITGAASGIGRACAIEYAQRGWEVLAIDRRESNIGRSIVADLADPDAIDRLDLGPLDVLLSNAGVAVVKPQALTTDDDWRWLLDINVLAPIRLVRAFAPQLRHGGQVAFVASLAGLFGAPGMVAYSTSKFALVGFAEAVRPELAALGIGVTVICPGYVKTGLHRATRYANPAFERMLDDPPRWYGMSAERVARRIADAIAARDAELVLGPEKLAWYAKRLSPALGRALARVVGRVSGVVR